MNIIEIEYQHKKERVLLDRAFSFSAFSKTIYNNNFVGCKVLDIKGRLIYTPFFITKKSFINISNKIELLILKNLVSKELIYK